MKRIITSTALALCVGFGAMAQSFSPVPGTLNKDENTKGLQAVTVNVPSGSFINREAGGYVELYRDGKLLMQIPAQNAQKLFMYEGFSTHLKNGPSMMIAFWNSGTESMIAGKYEVKVPAGFIMLGGTKANEPLSATYTVPTYTPEEMGQARGEKISEIHAITITLPEGATNIKYTDNSYQEQKPGSAEPTDVWSISVTCGKYAVYDKVQSVTSEGNKVTLTFSKTYSSPGVYTIDFLAGALTYEVNGTQYSYTNTLTYNVTGNLDGWTINPANGSTLKGGFKPVGTYMATRTIYENNVPTKVEAPIAYYFELDAPLPEGETMNPFTGAPKLYALNEDGTVSSTVAYTFNRPVLDPEVPNRVRICKGVLQQWDTSDIVLAPGNYVLRCPANMIRYSGGGMSPQIDFTFTVEDDPTMVRNFTVEPANDGEVNEITTITLTYPQGTDLSWANSGWATLSNGIAEYAFIHHNLTSDQKTEYYQTVSFDGNQVKFHLANPIREEGEWTLNIPVNSLLENGKSTPSVNKWNVVAAPVIKLADIMRLAIPAQNDVTLSQTFMGMGMGIVKWNINAEGIVINRQCAQKVEMYLDGEKIAELDPANEEQISTTGAGQAAEGDDTVIGISNILFVFADNPEAMAAFQKDGAYTIVVPDGLLLNYTTPVQGADVTYHFTSGLSVDLSYELSPADGATVKTEGIKEITLTFPNASSIEDSGTSAYLYFPNGERVIGLTSLSTIEGNKITWRYDDPKKGPIAWVSGQYKFVVREGRVAVDMPMESFDGENGNFPGLTAYINLDMPSGVEAIEGETNYTVIGIDGTVLVEEGSASDVKALAPGLYIINGKKVIVK